MVKYKSPRGASKSWPGSGSREGSRRKAKKVFRKLKKVLDKDGRVWYISKCRTERRANFEN